MLTVGSSVHASVSPISAFVAANSELIELRVEGGGGSRLVRTIPDAEPHWGGSIINGNCTAGFTVRRQSDNVRTSVTAGHCGTVGSSASSGHYFYGNFRGGGSDHPSYPDYDQARLQGSTYAPRIRTDDGQSLRDVRGATETVIGDSICQSGVFSESECHVIVGDMSATFCDDYDNPATCTTYLMSGRRDGEVVARGGDSGGPVYLKFPNAEAAIRGMVVAGTQCNTETGNGRRLFAERWNSISNHLKVEIVAN